MRGLVSDDHVTLTGRNGQWKSREKKFCDYSGLSFGGSLNQQGDQMDWFS